MNTIHNYILRDRTLIMKMMVISAGCLALSWVAAEVHIGYWLNGLLNTIGFGAFGFAGIAAMVRNEPLPFVHIPAASSKVAGMIVAILGFALAIAMIVLTLLVAAGIL